jgi:hypothetical protein
LAGIDALVKKQRNLGFGVDPLRAFAGCTVTNAKGTWAGSLTMTVRGCSAATVTLLASITRASMLKVPALPANSSSADGESGGLFKLFKPSGA